MVWCIRRVDIRRTYPDTPSSWSRQKSTVDIQVPASSQISRSRSRDSGHIVFLSPVVRYSTCWNRPGMRPWPCISAGHQPRRYRNTVSQHLMYYWSKLPKALQRLTIGERPASQRSLWPGQRHTRPPPTRESRPDETGGEIWRGRRSAQPAADRPISAQDPSPPSTTRSRPAAGQPVGQAQLDGGWPRG